MRRFAIALAAILAGCHAGPTPDAKPTPSSLEAAAVTAGIVPDPANTDPTGLYARDDDKVCVVPSAAGYRIGIYVGYGDQYSCSGSGSVTRAGETLHVDLTSATGCTFDARFEGDRIVMPGALPDACRQACTDRASLTGLSVERLSDSPSEAATMRDAKGNRLCANE